MPLIDLLVASTNSKKFTELKELLADLPLQLHSLKDFPSVKAIAETGTTFQENAILKAKGYAAQCGLLTLAEDSGLCCDALEGAPGVYSSRFAGDRATDDANNQKLIRLLKDIPDNCRGAHYVSMTALAEPSGHVVGTVEGQVHGYILRELKGSNGFGYDPLFFYPPFNRTFAEVQAELKHKVSHRAKALEKAKRMLAEYLRQKGYNFSEVFSEIAAKNAAGLNPPENRTDKR